MKRKEWENLEHAFFTIDEPRKIARVVLRYETPEEMFDRRCVSGTPLLSQETLAELVRVFGLLPAKYKVDLSLRFADFGTYTEERLRDIVLKNFALELKNRQSAAGKRDRLAYGFLAAGVLSFLLMFLFRRFASADSAAGELLFYLLDIGTTVLLYEAVTILSLERKEKLAALRDMHESFSALHFEKEAG